jgi:polyisoprenoid-binding protein YceI
VKQFLSLITAIIIVGATTNLAQAADKYKLDPRHTNIIWKAGHLGFSFPSGKFTNTEGTLFLDEKDLSKSKIEVTIKLATITTGDKKFDNHLASPDFFNVQKFKVANFKSTKVIMKSKNKAMIHGALTLNGITKPIVLNAKLNKLGISPASQKKTAGLSATATIKRSEFGIKFGLPGIEDNVKIDIETEAILAN